MASNIQVYFIHKDNFSKTVEYAQEIGYLAKETSTGYIQLAVNTYHELYKSRKDFENAEFELRNFIFSAQTKPSDVYFFAEECSDGHEGLNLTIYNNQHFKMEYNERYTDDVVSDKMKELFNVNSIYDHFCFDRSNEHLISEKQKKAREDKIQLIEDEKYKEWLNNFEKLSIAEQFERLFLSREHDSYFFGRNEKYKNLLSLEDEIKNIKRFYKIQ